MTLTDPTLTDPTTTTLTYDQVALDLYRDIHKGIRAELFAICGTAGSTDPGDAPGRRALADHVGDVMRLLVDHAHHEDGPIQPVLEVELPDLAARIAADHTTLEARIASLRDQADGMAVPATGDERASLHRLYVDLCDFTSAYLAHQDLEERVVMPALQQAVGVDAVVAIHQAIVGPMPPEELAASLAIMLPAMNLEDRTEMLGGMAQGMPAEVFDGVWSLAGTILVPSDLAELGRRLDRQPER